MQTKLGLLRLRLSPAVFSRSFRQELDLEKSEVRVAGETPGGNGVPSTAPGQYTTPGASALSVARARTAPGSGPCRQRVACHMQPAPRRNRCCRGSSGAATGTPGRTRDPGRDSCPGCPERHPWRSTCTPRILPLLPSDRPRTARALRPRLRARPRGSEATAERETDHGRRQSLHSCGPCGGDEARSESQRGRNWSRGFAAKHVDVPIWHMTT